MHFTKRTYPGTEHCLLFVGLATPHECNLNMEVFPFQSSPQIVTTSLSTYLPIFLDIGDRQICTNLG